MGLLISSTLMAETIVSEENELSCANKSALEFALDGIAKYSNNKAFLSGYLSRVRCNWLTEGTDLLVIKRKKLNLSHEKVKTTGIIVKLPTGMTTYIAR